MNINDFFIPIKGSYPRNLFLFSNLERIDLVEKAGSGFLRIKRAMDLYKLEMVDISFSKRLFGPTFLRPDMNINSYQSRVIEGYGNRITEIAVEKTSEKIIELMNQKPEISASQLSNIIGISQRAVEMQISKLQRQGIIKRVGLDKGGHWEVVK